MKLNQLIAIVNGQKTKAANAVTRVYKKIQKSDSMLGLSRKYSPIDEEGEKLPDEYKKVQYTCNQAIEEVETTLSEIWDLVLMQDKANCEARATIAVDNTAILADVPVTSLIYLEKQLTDFHTFVNTLPVLDPGEDWKQDTTGLYRTNTKESIRTKKVPRNHVKAEATKEHPAQVEVYTEDIPVGRWESYGISGMISEQRKNTIVDRVEKLRDAVKLAREEANLQEVKKQNVSQLLFDYILK